MRADSISFRLFFAFFYFFFFLRDISLQPSIPSLPLKLQRSK